MDETTTRRNTRTEGGPSGVTLDEFGGVGNDGNDNVGNDGTTVDSGGPEPKRRGRPRKQRNDDNQTAGTKPETITVETGEAPVTRRRSPGRPRKSKVSSDEANATAHVILTMLDTAAMNVAGPHAVQNSFERSLIEPSLRRTLERGGAPAERVTALIDPLALVMGMTMWGTRVLGERQNRLAAMRAGYPPPSEPTPTAHAAAAVVPFPTPNGNTEPTDNPATYSGLSDDVLRITER